jgi:hypothetical protein
MADDIGELGVMAHENTAAEFQTYEDYLDSQITPLDLFYLEVLLLDLG